MDGRHAAGHDDPVRRVPVLVVTGLLVALASSACATTPPCTGAFTVDMSADVDGAPDARAALDDWLDGTSPVGEAPESAPRSGWEETGDRPDVVTWENGDWRVTVFRTTQDEWIVTTLECV